MAATITTKTTIKNLPEALVAGLKDLPHQRRNCRVVVVNDDAWSTTAWNTTWDGGSIEEHYTYNFGSDSLVSMSSLRNGHKVTVAAGSAIVVTSVFCGKICDPVVYVRNVDLAAFYGVELPAEFVGMPAEIAADWINGECGEKITGRRATKEEKAKRLAAEMLRTLCGVAAA